MALEIERKFLVKDDSYKAMAYHASRIAQGYICSMRGRTVPGEGLLILKSFRLCWALLPKKPTSSWNP